MSVISLENYLISFLKGRILIESLFNVNGKIILITGSNRGIGFSLAQGFCEAGAEVVLNRRSESSLNEAPGKLEKGGFKVKRVETLTDDHYAAGRHTIQFDAHGLASGIYYYRIAAGKYTAVQRMLLMK